MLYENNLNICNIYVFILINSIIYKTKLYIIDNRYKYLKQ